MSNMNPDLEWLARNVSEWNPPKRFCDENGDSLIRKTGPDAALHCGPNSIAASDPRERCYTKAQWLQARKDLGLIMSDSEEEMLVEERPKKYGKYFKDVRHLDRIDVYRTVDLFGCEKHGHAISHAAKKLLLTGARTGGKDVETEIQEAIDSLNRWLEMRQEDARARELEG